MKKAVVTLLAVYLCGSIMAQSLVGESYKKVIDEAKKINLNPVVEDKEVGGVKVKVLTLNTENEMIMHYFSPTDTAKIIYKTVYLPKNTNIINKKVSYINKQYVAVENSITDWIDYSIPGRIVKVGFMTSKETVMFVYDLLYN